jgi:hypothetical protein
MRSRRGLFASLAFLLALPLTALYYMAFGTGVEAVIHGALALGSALMSFAVFDFKTPRWATWIGSASTGALATVFFLQGLSEVTHDEALTYLAYQVVGQRLEGWLVDLFMAWCVVVLAVDRQVRRRTLGIVAMATVACVKAYCLGLAYHGTSLDTMVPILKILWLMPFVWILFESTTRKEMPIGSGDIANEHAQS